MLTTHGQAPAQSNLPAALFAIADYVCPNETELSLLSGMPVTDVPSAVTGARILQAAGANHVLVTLGSQGCVLVPKVDAAESEPLHVPCPRVHAIDTTGAGDSFLGAFGYFLSRGLSMRECLVRANTVASHSVQGTGTQTSYGSAATFTFA
jgi:ribokinase